MVKQKMLLPTVGRGKKWPYLLSAVQKESGRWSSQSPLPHRALFSWAALSSLGVRLSPADAYLLWPCLFGLVLGPLLGVLSREIAQKYDQRMEIKLYTAVSDTCTFLVDYAASTLRALLILRYLSSLNCHLQELQKIILLFFLLQMQCFEFL